MNLKKFSILLLAFALFISLVACNSEPSDVSDESTQSEPSQEVSTTEEEAMFDGLPDVDYEGREVKILVGGAEYGERYQSREIFTDDEKSGELINDAVLERNQIVEEEFGIKITGYAMGSGESLITKIQTLFNSGDPEFDILAPYMDSAATLASEGYFYNLKDIPNMRLDREFWDQRAVEDLEIFGKVYFAVGYIGILDNECTQCMIFNKTVASQYLDEDLYQVVKDGEWTIDKMIEVSRKVTSDIDGEPGMTYNDLWGLYINSPEPIHMFVAAGQRYIQKDENGSPYVTIDTQEAYQVINKLADVMGDRQASIIIENLRDEAQAAGFKDVYYLASEQIANGKALLRTMCLVDLGDLAEKDFEFGILPLPKYNEDQESYYSNVSTFPVASYAIPIQANDKDFSALVLSALCEASEDTLNEAYYEKLLTNRRFTDTESREMLDIIFNDRVYDLGVVFNWGNIRDILYTSIQNGQNNFSSTWDSQETIVENAMQKTIEAFQMLD